MDNNEKHDMDEFVGKYEAFEPINCVDLKNQLKNSTSNFAS